MTADPRPIIEPDTARGARGLPLTPVVTTRRTVQPLRHSPFRVTETVPEPTQPEALDRFTAVAYDDDVSVAATLTSQGDAKPDGNPATRRVDTLNLDRAARDADIAQRYTAGETIPDIAAHHGVDLTTIRRALNRTGTQRRDQTKPKETP